MGYERTFFQWMLDQAYGALKYPNGWTRLEVARGYFLNDENGFYQHLFFHELMDGGFQRTPWQLVFPKQTAGLIKKVEPDEHGLDEYHVRFYHDGVIACELEVNRFNTRHWNSPSKQEIYLLEDLLDSMQHLPDDTRQRISNQFGVRDYSEHCVRGFDGPDDSILLQ